MTKSQEIAADIAALLRARNPLIWVVTREEARVERYLIEAAAAANYEPIFWDIAQGATTVKGTKLPGDFQDPAAAFGEIDSRARQNKKLRNAWVMRDLAPWLEGTPGAAPARQLRNLARSLPATVRESAQAVIVLSTSGDIPASLSGHATVIEWPMPDRAEIAAILDAAIEGLPDDLKATAAPNGTREAAIDAAVGLSGEEAASCYAKSLVQLRRIDAAAVSKEKSRVIARERVLEWYDPIPGGLDSVGGLDNLKGWLISRKNAYTPEARAYGLPAPKGAMLVGVPGCGKSLTAKAIATAWGVPLLRVDLGALKSKFVGESEGNLRKAFRVIEAIGRCVVWFDEIEKALQGATSGSADGGVSSDALGSILSWMQERQGEAFVIATANDVTGLPPELLRKGRFDEVWFVDLPNPQERYDITLAAARSLRQSSFSDMERIGELTAATEGFTGSEIAALVPDALYRSFADGARPMKIADLLEAARTVVPLSKTAEEKIKALRDWASTRARAATAPLKSATSAKAKRQIDL